MQTIFSCAINSWNQNEIFQWTQMHLIGNFEFGGIIAIFSEQRQILDIVFPMKQELWFLFCSPPYVITQLCLFKEWWILTNGSVVSPLLLTQAKRHWKDTSWPVPDMQPAALQGFKLGHFKPSVNTLVHRSPMPYFTSKKTSLCPNIHWAGFKAEVTTYGERGSPGKGPQLDYQKEPVIRLPTLWQVQGKMKNPAFSTVIPGSTERVFISRI